MTRYPVAKVWLRWRPPAEGGRSTPPRGPVYAATGHFADEPISNSFSVALQLAGAVPASDGELAEVYLTLLAPENLPEVVRRIAPGEMIQVTEGAQPVADCKIVSVSEQVLDHPWPNWQSE